MRRRLLAAVGLTAVAAAPWWARPLPPPVAPTAAASWRGVRWATLDGGEQALIDGHRPLVVNLWARWCGPCRHELPALQRWAPTLHERGIAVATVALDDDAFALREYVHEVGLTLPVWLAASSALPRAIRPDRLPQTVLVAADGRERCRVIGARDWDAAAARRELLGEPAA